MPINNILLCLRRSWPGYMWKNFPARSALSAVWVAFAPGWGWGGTSAAAPGYYAAVGVDLYTRVIFCRSGSGSTCGPGAVCFLYIRRGGCRWGRCGGSLPHCGASYGLRRGPPFLVDLCAGGGLVSDGSPGVRRPGPPGLVPAALRLWLYRSMSPVKEGPALGSPGVSASTFVNICQPLPRVNAALIGSYRQRVSIVAWVPSAYKKNGLLWPLVFPGSGSILWAAPPLSRSGGVRLL